MKKKERNLPQPISLWRTLGPSFILLGLALGSGELILWPYLAAHYGMGLMWGALLGISFQFVLNTEIMRYSLAWSESVFVGFRKLSILITIWFIISTFIPWSLPGFSSAASNILTKVFPILPETGVAIALLLLTGLLLSAGSTVYKTMETFQKTVILIGLPFMFILAMLLTGQQDWIDTAWGLVGRGDGWWFFPEGVALAAFLGAFAYSGAGGNLNLAQSYYIKEKGFGMGKHSEKVSSLFSGKAVPAQLNGHTFDNTPANRKKWNSWWRLVNQEHFLVFWLLGFVTILILSALAKATVFGSATEEGLSFLYAEGAVISQQLGSVVGMFFLLVAALMLFSTQVGVLESSSRIISENVLLLFYKKNKKMNLSLGFYIALWSQIILGMIIYMAGFQEPRVLLTLSAILNAAAMMMSFLFIYVLNRLKVHKDYQPNMIRKLIMLAAFIFFAIFLFVTFADYLSA